MVFRKIEPNTWKFEKDGDFISGKLMQIRLNVGVNSSSIYELKKEDGSIFSIWDTAILGEKMHFVMLGDTVKIVYKGKKKGKNNKDYHDFDVFIDDGRKE